MTTDPLETGTKLNEAVREVSDFLTGAVTTLVREGWTEEQARTIVVTMYAAHAKGDR